MPRRMLLHIASLCLLSSPLLAQGAPNKEATEEFAGEAREGAPERISDQAGIARMDPKGKVTPVSQSKNGFTCTLMPDESRSPVCADERGFAWLEAAMSQKPQPPAIDKPGIAYMAKGGVHYETSDGKIDDDAGGRDQGGEGAAALDAHLAVRLRQHRHSNEAECRWHLHHVRGDAVRAPDGAPGSEDAEAVTFTPSVHPERSEGGHAGMVPFTAFRVTEGECLLPRIATTGSIRAALSAGSQQAARPISVIIQVTPPRGK